MASRAVLGVGCASPCVSTSCSGSASAAPPRRRRGLVRRGRSSSALGQPPGRGACVSTSWRYGGCRSSLRLVPAVAVRAMGVIGGTTWSCSLTAWNAAGAACVREPANAWAPAMRLVHGAATGSCAGGAGVSWRGSWRGAGVRCGASRSRAFRARRHGFRSASRAWRPRRLRVVARRAFTRSLRRHHGRHDGGDGVHRLHRSRPAAASCTGMRFEARSLGVDWRGSRAGLRRARRAVLAARDDSARVFRGPRARASRPSGLAAAARESSRGPRDSTRSRLIAARLSSAAFAAAFAARLLSPRPLAAAIHRAPPSRLRSWPRSAARHRARASAATAALSIAPALPSRARALFERGLRRARAAARPAAGSAGFLSHPKSVSRGRAFPPARLVREPRAAPGVRRGTRGRRRFRIRRHRRGLVRTDAFHERLGTRSRGLRALRAAGPPAPRRARSPSRSWASARPAASRRGAGARRGSSAWRGSGSG